STTHPGGTSDPGLTYTYSFDSMLRPYSMVDNQSTPVTWMQGVTYGAADNILSLNTPSFTESRQYNALNQVTLINRPNIFAIQYNYSATQNNGRISSALDYRISETVN